MIQRLQSVWLFLAAFFAILSFWLPFYSGTVTNPDNESHYSKLTASYNFLTLILTGIMAAGCLIIIFMYKERKIQFRLTIAAGVLSIINLIIYFNQLSKFEKGNLSFAAILTFAIPVFLFLAARGIWKDEKLVKSLDRLR